MSTDQLRVLELEIDRGYEGLLTSSAGGRKIDPARIRLPFPERRGGAKYVYAYCRGFGDGGGGEGGGREFHAEAITRRFGQVRLPRASFKRAGPRRERVAY